MSDIKRAITTLRRASERFNQEISKALSSLEKATILPLRADFKTSIRQLIETQKSMNLTDIKKAVRARTLTEVKPSVENLIKEGILRVDEKTLGKGRKIIGKTVLHLGSLTPSVRTILSENAFLNVSREEYKRFQQSSPVAPYVSIKFLRDAVCRRLTIDRDLFDSMLVSIATRDPYSVQLSTGTGDKGTGIYYGRGECHVVIIK